MVERKMPEADSADNSVQKPPLAFRVGGRVVTDDGFFAKIVGMGYGAKESEVLLELDVAGIGFREGVPASCVKPSDRRSRPPARPRSLSRDRRQKETPRKSTLDMDMETEAVRFQQTSELLDSVMKENNRLQISLNTDRQIIGSPLQDRIVDDSREHEASPLPVARKAILVPILRMSGLSISKEADLESPSKGCMSPRTSIKESPSKGCMSPRTTSVMEEHQRHLQESMHKAETLESAVGTITEGVSAWKEAIEQDRKEQEEWHRTKSPRVKRMSTSAQQSLTREKQEITPKITSQSPAWSDVQKNEIHPPSSHKATTDDAPK